MITDVSGLLEEVTNRIKEQTDVAVVGLSGGADSTLVACLCIRALGKENVYGVHMPYNKLDNETFNSKSVALADHLGVPQRTVWIDDAVNMLAGQYNHLSTINLGNMRSRMRMISLYTTCCSIGETTGLRTRVIGTGNLSEDFIGYDTKGGDAMCDFFPIGSLLKSEVYQLLEYFRDEGMITEEMINRTPSAGLWDGQTDEDELGYTYAEMEPYVLKGFTEGADALSPNDPLAMFVYNRHFDNKHKHEASPAFNLRRFCDG